MAEDKLTQEELRRHIHYNQETGIMTWILPTTHRVHIGRIVGTKSNGYVLTMLFGKRQYVHRLAWLYVYGKFPKVEIDHINGNKSDNRIINLREANRSQNSMNRGPAIKNISGHKGVVWDKERNKWVVRCGYSGKVKNGAVLEKQ